ncbi:hypothetical protein MCZ36_15280 [Bacillus safensis]|uniref:hypothetical protein n=1 Tax=Bacillus safensis TaxID=561879 RepID=UPI002282F319|nr:hypothetical protein [Bacillus safensis]MCY7446342.1 hypothetical protein [Bacillus safensis]MCY7459151.1 hypothetical protein [Bacillus safensis]
MNNRERAIEIFEIEIKRQCDIFFSSVEYLKECLDSEKREQRQKIWYHVQSFLTSSANISRLLWGSYTKDYAKYKLRKELRKELRKKLNVSESSTLKSRKMRNLFEHFDEHIEEWATQPNSNYIDSNIGPKSAISIEGLNENQYLRHFDPSTGIITYQSYEYDMNEIVNEIYNIYTENFVK